jgi:hypothetical protein
MPEAKKRWISPLMARMQEAYESGQTLTLGKSEFILTFQQLELAEKVGLVSEDKLSINRERISNRLPVLIEPKQ